MALPTEFCTRMHSLLGENAPTFFASLDTEPCRALRYNEKILSEDALVHILGDALGKKIPFGQGGFYFSLDGIGNTALHHSGGIYVQEPAAMAPVAALGGERVCAILDLCSAPGGKSLQAAASLLAEDGILVCNEPAAIRRKALMQNLERLGEKPGLARKIYNKIKQMYRMATAAAGGEGCAYAATGGTAGSEEPLNWRFLVKSDEIAIPNLCTCCIEKIVHFDYYI
jgi:16S rRNA C967 or C1407 C5-methylase (RsmB/RsmF family)